MIMMTMRRDDYMFYTQFSGARLPFVYHCVMSLSSAPRTPDLTFNVILYLQSTFQLHKTVERILTAGHTDVSAVSDMHW